MNDQEIFFAWKAASPTVRTQRRNPIIPGRRWTAFAALVWRDRLGLPESAGSQHRNKALALERLSALGAGQGELAADDRLIL